MLTVKTAAARAGISPALVYVWIEKGVLPHFRMGRPGRRGTIKIAESDFEAFLDSLKRGDGPTESIPSVPRRKVILKHLRLKQG